VYGGYLVTSEMVYLRTYMEWWQSVLFGLVQGVTEFLPISSSGHLILAQELLLDQDGHLLAFNVFVHLGTLLAVVVYFWRDLLLLTQTLFRKLGRLPVNERDWVLLVSLLIATIPAVGVGLALGWFIEAYLMFPVSVAMALIAGSFLFIYAEWRQHAHPEQRALTVRSGFFIGCFQVLALIPGFSRSGATLAGGMLLGLSRYEAARFSFLLAIPVIAGASVKVTFDFLSDPGTVSLVAVVFGAVTAFLVAFVVIHWFLSFVRRHTLWPFIWYRFALAILILYKEFLV